MWAALTVHDEVLRTAIEAHAGFVFSHTGDGVVAAFASPMSAAIVAIDTQRELQLWCGWDWQPARPSCETGDYFGTVLNRAVRTT